MTNFLQRANKIAQKFTFSHILQGKNEDQVFEFLRDHFFHSNFSIEEHTLETFSEELCVNLGCYAYLLTNADISEMYDLLQDYLNSKKKD